MVKFTSNEKKRSNRGQERLRSLEKKLGFLENRSGGGGSSSSTPSGDVSGPASSTDNAIARFDGVTGETLQDSGATIDDSGNLTATNFSGSSSGANTGDQVLPVGANPTGTASDVAVNGVATSFMRSDGAPAVQKGSSSAFGLVKVDNSTITAASGVISTPGGANPTATAGDTAVNGTAATFMRSDGSPAIQKTSSSVFGLAKVDNVTITASAGVISAVASSSPPGLDSVMDRWPLDLIHGGSGSSTVYTDENAEDAVGGILTDTATIDFTYNDGANTITADVKSASITEAMQVLADNTTNDVSTTKHGYVPKAPNDSTKFLNGTGAYSVPTGGSTDIMTVMNTNSVASNTNAQAFRGEKITPLTTFSVSRIVVVLAAPANGGTYQACISALDGSDNLTSVNMSSNSYVAVGTGIQTVTFYWSTPISCVAGTAVAIMFGRTDGTDTDASGFGSNATFSHFMLPCTQSTTTSLILLAHATPTIGQTLTNRTGSLAMTISIKF